jgi:hypothetical protein
VLDEVGFVGALVARPLPDGSLQLVDGHLRAETLPDAELPVLVVDLTDEEAARLLAVYDPLTSLAESQTERLAELFASIELRHAALQELVTSVIERRTQAMNEALPAIVASSAIGSARVNAASDANNESDSKSENDSDPSDEPTDSSKIPKQFRATYQVVVDCTSEQQQRGVFTRLTEEGLRCRVLTLT